VITLIKSSSLLSVISITELAIRASNHGGMIHPV